MEHQHQPCNIALHCTFCNGAPTSALQYCTSLYLLQWSTNISLAIMHFTVHFAMEHQHQPYNVALHCTFCNGAPTSSLQYCTSLHILQWSTNISLAILHLSVHFSMEHQHQPCNVHFTALTCTFCNGAPTSALQESNLQCIQKTVWCQLRAMYMCNSDVRRIYWRPIDFIITMI